MNDAPATPPSQVQRLTVEQLAEQVRDLHDLRATDYAEIRDLRNLVGANALAIGHQVGVLSGLVAELRDVVQALGHGPKRTFWQRWGFR